MATTAQPVLYGAPQTGPPFYDLAQKRWLPVGSGQTSPDGSAYAYAVAGPSITDPTDVHVVTVATGGDHVLKVSPPPAGAAMGWEVGDFDGTYVYLLGEQFEQYPRGVWRVNASTGALTQVSQSGSILMLRGADLWVGLVNPADPSPPRPPRSGETFDSIAEVNLTTGTANTWIYRPGEAVYPLGLDGVGHLVVSIADGPDFNISLGKVRVLASPGDGGTQISDGSLSYYQMQGDTGRIWFGTDRGVYLWTQVGGLEKVFASGQPIDVAGRCV